MGPWVTTWGLGLEGGSQAKLVSPGLHMVLRMVNVCACLCVCVRETETERDRERQRDTERLCATLCV